MDINNETAKKTIEKARKDAQTTFRELSPMVKEVVNKHSKEIDAIIAKIKKDLAVLTNKELQTYMLQLSIEAYEFAQSKDLATLQQECALVTQKHKQASIFNGTVGTQVVRTNESITGSVDQQVVTMIYNAVANCMKSKLDEVHRIVNILSNVLISRNAENKLKGAPVDYEGNLCNYSIPENKPSES